MEGNPFDKGNPHEYYSYQCNGRTIQHLYATFSQHRPTWICMQNSPLQGFQLYPVSSPHRLSVGTIAYRCRCSTSRKKEISWDAVRYHFTKWSGDGSLERVWQHSIHRVQQVLDLSQLNLDG